MNKSKILRWAGHVARKEEIRITLKILTSKPTGNRALGSLGINGRIIIEWRSV